jgi:hypothetical protein
MTGNMFHELSDFLSGAAEASHFFRYVSTLDDETTMLSRSVEHKSPNDAAPHPRTTDSSSLMKSSEARTDVHTEEQSSL